MQSTGSHIQELPSQKKNSIAASAVILSKVQGKVDLQLSALQ
jgi:hypothetical protein